MGAVFVETGETGLRRLNVQNAPLNSTKSGAAVSGIPVVTIDGPAASGKSSVSRELARRLGWSWVSTGAFYRGLAYVADELKVDFTDEAALVATATSNSWAVEMAHEKTRVVLNGRDVTDEVNREQVGNRASIVSSLPKVRAALLEAQRRCALGVKGLVAEGRDCGTVVFPNANVKVFLTARAEDRAARRAKDEGRSVEETQDAQKIRDSQDANRKTAPMQASADSVTIDTTQLGFIEVVDLIEGLVRERISVLNA